MGVPGTRYLVRVFTYLADRGRFIISVHFKTMSTTAPPSSPSTPLSFDLEAYIGRYPTQSETRLQRLVFIYRKAIAENDSELAQQAKNLASEQIRATSNTKRYKELFVEQQQDAAWIAQVEQESMALQEALEGRLSAAQAHLNKEAIRMAYLAFCDFYRPRGDLREAMRAALRSRDYCTNRNQTAHVCLLIMELAMDMREFFRLLKLHKFTSFGKNNILNFHIAHFRFPPQKTIHKCMIMLLRQSIPSFLETSLSQSSSRWPQDWHTLLRDVSNRRPRP